MGAFSIFTREGESADGLLSAAEQPTLLSYRRDPRVAPGALLSEAPSRTRLPSEALPPVALCIPDLEDLQSSRWQSLVGPFLFWFAIGLGALLAVALIWSGHSPARRAVGEPPAWTSQGPDRGYLP